ncbi:unnamed protein product [Aphis gossypii]|uniref:Uncharacterized protein n=1 Tax=Aphis gossypii TaxID=80765 RepID=A0A9P0IMG9_APHGO|nr:unnamed protein product [Aphis gossypii]
MDWNLRYRERSVAIHVILILFIFACLTFRAGVVTIFNFLWLILKIYPKNRTYHFGCMLLKFM